MNQIFLYFILLILCIELVSTQNEKVFNKRENPSFLPSIEAKYVKGNNKHEDSLLTSTEGTEKNETEIENNLNEEAKGDNVDKNDSQVSPDSEKTSTSITPVSTTTTPVASAAPSTKSVNDIKTNTVASTTKTVIPVTSTKKPIVNNPKPSVTATSALKPQQSNVINNLPNNNGNTQIPGNSNTSTNSNASVNTNGNTQNSILSNSGNDSNQTTNNLAAPSIENTSNVVPPENNIQNNAFNENDSPSTLTTPSSPQINVNSADGMVSNEDNGEKKSSTFSIIAKVGAGLLVGGIAVAGLIVGKNKFDSRNQTDDNIYRNPSSISETVGLNTDYKIISPSSSTSTMKSGINDDQYPILELNNNYNEKGEEEDDNNFYIDINPIPNSNTYVNVQPVQNEQTRQADYYNDLPELATNEQKKSNYYNAMNESEVTIDSIANKISNPADLLPNIVNKVDIQLPVYSMEEEKYNTTGRQMDSISNEPSQNEETDNHGYKNIVPEMGQMVIEHTNYPSFTSSMFDAMENLDDLKDIDINDDHDKKEEEVKKYAKGNGTTGENMKTIVPDIQIATIEMNNEFNIPELDEDNSAAGENMKTIVPDIQVATIEMNNEFNISELDEDSFDNSSRQPSAMIDEKYKSLNPNFLLLPNLNDGNHLSVATYSSNQNDSIITEERPECMNNFKQISDTYRNALRNTFMSDNESVNSSTSILHKIHKI